MFHASFHHHNGNRTRAVVAAMAHVRKRLCGRLRDLMAAGDEQFSAGWTALVAEIEAGFRQEETIMETLRYPGLRPHLADNACALGALHRITPQVEAGDAALGRQALGALCDILELHRFTAGVALTGTPTRPASMPGRFKAGRGSPGITRRPLAERAADSGRQRHHRH